MTSEDNNSRSSNVIKIFNPIRPSTIEGQDENVRKISIEPKKEGDRNYEFSSDLKKQEYLSDDNQS